MSPEQNKNSFVIKWVNSKETPAAWSKLSNEDSQLKIGRKKHPLRKRIVAKSFAMKDIAADRIGSLTGLHLSKRWSRETADELILFPIVIQLWGSIGGSRQRIKKRKYGKTIVARRNYFPPKRVRETGLTRGLKNEEKSAKRK